MYKKILLGVDGSDVSNNAIKKVIELKKSLGSEVVIIHSVKHHYIPQMVPVLFPFGLNITHTLSSVDVENIREDYKRAGEMILKNAEDDFKKENLDVETILDLDESPEDYVKRVVKIENYDLVVIGYKGHHSHLRTAIIGTVAEKLVEAIDCDLLIVK